MTREEIKALIDSDVNTNGTEAITGAILNNVLTEILDFSQDEPFVFRNNSGSNIAKGDIVEISGYDTVNSIIEVQKLETATVKSNFFIALENVLNATDGSFAKTGLITGLSGLDSFTIGDKLYWDLSTATYTATASPSNLFVGVVVQTASPNGAIEIQLNQNPRLYGNGTANRVVRWSDSENLTDSIIRDNGTAVGINQNAINNGIPFSITGFDSTTRAIQILNSSTTILGERFGIYGYVSNGELNTGIYFLVQNDSNIVTGAKFIVQGLGTKYSLELRDGTELSGKFLKSMTNNGQSNWAFITESDIQDFGTYAKVGTYTNLFIPRWNAVTNTLESGAIRDNGTNISIGEAIDTATLVNVYASGDVLDNVAKFENINSIDSVNVIAYATKNYSQNLLPTFGTAIGGLFVASGSAIQYALHLQDGTEGLNKVLISATADGKTNFSSLKTVNGNSLLGSGDINTRSKSIQTITSSATVTPVSGNDLVVITAQSVGLTLANPTGSWSQGDELTIRIKDNGVAQNITYGTKYRQFSTLPTTTIAGKTTYLGCIYNSTDDKFDVIGISTEA